MVQPKQPPLSIRPGDVRLAKIDAYATKHGLKRHAAILELLDVALDGRFAVAVTRPTPKPVPGSDAAKRKAEKAAAKQIAETWGRPKVAPSSPELSITSDYAKRVEARVAKGGFKPQATPFVEKFRGVTASGEPLPDRKPQQKGPKK